MKGFQKVLSQAIVPCCGKEVSLTFLFLFVQCSSYFRLQASTLWMCESIVSFVIELSK